MSLSMPEGQAELAATRRPSAIRDYLALTKPAINRMCLIMAGGGMLLAGAHVESSLGIWQALIALLGTALAVASANALNMWLERDSDRKMKRTAARPLAERRISERGAFAFGTALGMLAVTLLAAFTNLATTLLGAAAILSYVAIYTPLKYRHPLALVVGAVPGAVPPLMGWTAVTGRIDLAGLVLFGILFIWQMPHFLAIAVFRNHDYGAAHIRTVAAVRGYAVARWQAIAWAVVLVPTSLALTALGVTGILYMIVSAALGLAFLAFAVLPLDRPSPARWAYRLFAASLVYLPALVTALAIDVLL